MHWHAIDEVDRGAFRTSIHQKAHVYIGLAERRQMAKLPPICCARSDPAYYTAAAINHIIPSDFWANV